MATQAAMTQAQAAALLRQQNMAIRQFITGSCPHDLQQIYSATVAQGGSVSGQLVNVLPKNVGLVTGFYVRAECDLVVPAGMTLTRNALGASNMLSKIEFVDLSNLTRISTTGWHLALLNSARYRRPSGSAYATDTPLGFGSNMGNGINLPATIGAGTTRISMVYFVPLAYSKDDLRGAIFASVVNATMSLNLTFNPAIAAFGTDTVLSPYSQSGAGAVVAQNAKLTVYQEFYDQLPINASGPSLPVQDLTTIYSLKQTALVGLAAGQDFPVPFANFSQFLSTTIVFDNGGTLNPGTDLNTVQLTTANASLLWKEEPWLIGFKTRNLLQLDPPAGTYYFDHRRRPINTVQYGNQQLLLNPNQVNTGAQLFVGWEMMTQQGVMNASGSLPAG